MTATTDPSGASFRPSMLIYDTRYRSMTFQILALIGFLILVGWLIRNTAQNLGDLGKEPNFRFMAESANYDINQHLIPYDSQSTNLRAALVGILNTLLVAVLGCTLATIVGVTVGVLRLSRNWLVAKIMTVYVEMFRNVPVLLWIVLFMAVLIESLPSPGAFRGGDAQMQVFGSVAITNQGMFIPRLMNTQYAWVVLLVVLASLLGVVWIRRRADRVQDQTGQRPGTVWPILGVLFVPAILSFLILSQFTRSNEYTFITSAQHEVATLAGATELERFDLCYPSGSASSLGAREYLDANEIAYRRKSYFGKSTANEAFASANCDLLVVPADDAETLARNFADRMGASAQVTVLGDIIHEGQAIQVEYPEITETGIPRFEGGTLIRNSLMALCLALGLYTAAFVAEIVRAGVLAISHGQTEAAAALGMRPRRIMNLVILPQALRVIIPPLISQYLNLTKNSSLAIAVGYMDITGTLMGITMTTTGRELETVMLGMLIYLMISLAISLAMNIYNNRVRLVER